MEIFSYKKLLDIFIEFSLELFSDPSRLLAGVIAPEGQGLEEHGQVLDQEGSTWKTFLRKSY